MRTVALLLLVVLAAPAHAVGECPVDRTDEKAVEPLFRAAPSCPAAAALFRACETRTEADVRRAIGVAWRCEMDVLPNVTLADYQKYGAEVRECWERTSDPRCVVEAGERYRERHRSAATRAAESGSFQSR